MISYHAKHMMGSHGPGYYVIRRENGVDTTLPLFHGNFLESRTEAELTAKYLNDKAQGRGRQVERNTDIRRRWANG